MTAESFGADIAALGGARRLAAVRRYSTPVLDCAIWAVALTETRFLRYGLNPHVTFDRDLLEAILVACGLQIVIGTVTQLYRVRWRIASFEEFQALAITVAIATALVLIWDLTDRHHATPTSTLLAGGATTLVGCAVIRSIWRLFAERTRRPPSSATRAVVVGMGHAGEQLVHALLVDPDSPYVPVAVLDDDPEKLRLRVRHLRVEGGIDQLPAVARSHNAQAVIVAIPSADAALIRHVSELAAQIDIMVRVLPPVHEFLTCSVGLDHIRAVTPEDLLGRRVIETDVASIAGYITGRRVLVTGAGGSIGSELCRHIVGFAPERLVMLDRDESALHGVQLSIEGRALLDSRNLVVCDIRDREAVKAVFAEHQPDVVFHAAALKHLPLLEMWPAEAYKTNVVGTQNVLDAAQSAAVSRFVNVSTDKAANPTSVLGYSKRLAERLTAAVAERSDGVYLSVRFGNVLGSRGSVLTAFREQIASGGPVTVTHPDVTRYFMTVGEAVQLVIQAGAIGRSGEVLILDMGEPVKIADVAHRLILENGGDIQIAYTGLRPGEKLEEELFGKGEDDVRPCHPLISQCAAEPMDFSELLTLGLPHTATDLRTRMAELCCSATDPSYESVV